MRKSIDSATLKIMLLFGTCISIPFILFVYFLCSKVGDAQATAHQSQSRRTADSIHHITDSIRIEYLDGGIIDTLNYAR